MAKERLRKWWWCQASLNFADDEEVLYWAHEAGCKMVFLGFEAEDLDALAGVNKRLNARRGIEAYDEAIRRIHKAGMAVLGAFIFGIDGDTPEKLVRRTEYINQSLIDVVQVTTLTPLPGTRLFEQLAGEGRLLYPDFPHDWQHYNMTEVVHRPAGMSPLTLSRVLRECYQRIYDLPVLERKAAMTYGETRDRVAAAIAWESHLTYREVAIAPSTFPDPPVDGREKWPVRARSA
jgi:radical SAM superfamily enzyme YgiQ (UPF0313 family)